MCGAFAASAHATPAARPHNPLAKFSADQIAKKAIADLQSASSFHIYQAGKEKGQTFSVSLSITRKGCTGTYKLGNVGAFLVIEIGSTSYLQPNDQMWESLGIPADQLSQFSGMWLEDTSTDKGNIGSECAIKNAAANLGLRSSGLVKGRIATIAHHEALRLMGKRGLPSYYVTLSRKPEFLTADSKAAGLFTFSAYNAKVILTAPSASEILPNPPGGPGSVNSVLNLARALPYANRLIVPMTLTRDVISRSAELF